MKQVVLAAVFSCVASSPQAGLVTWDLTGDGGKLGNTESFVGVGTDALLTVSGRAADIGGAQSNCGIGQNGKGLGCRRANNKLSNTEDNAPSYEYLSFARPTGISFTSLILSKWGQGEQAWIGGSETPIVADFSNLISAVGATTLLTSSGSSTLNITNSDFNFLIVGISRDTSAAGQGSDSLAPSRFRVGQVTGVPVPATIALMVMGLLLIGARRKQSP